LGPSCLHGPCWRFCPRVKPLLQSGRVGIAPARQNAWRGRVTRNAHPRSVIRERGPPMKIVSFETPAVLRLGVVQGDHVVDLQAADAKVPNELGALLASTKGDLSSIKELANRAPASARRPLKGIKYALPVGRPGKIICLGLNYLEHVKEGSQRDNIPKFPTI